MKLRYLAAPCAATVTPKPNAQLPYAGELSAAGGFVFVARPSNCSAPKRPSSATQRRHVDPCRPDRSGVTPESRAGLFKKIKLLEIKQCPFANLRAGLTSAKMAKFEFVEWTSDGHSAQQVCGIAPG
jgi:hypothetical protein